MKLTLGTYTKRISQGIYTIELNEDNKMLENLVLLTEIQHPTYLDIQGNRLYTVVKDKASGLRMYEDMKFINQITQEETPPCYVSSISESGMVFSANYHEGHIDLYSTQEDKLNHLQRITYPEGSHAHCIAYAQSFNEVYVCDLGLNKVLTYTLINQRLILKHTFNTLPKQGPRHFVIHPILPILYVFAELSSEVLVLRRYDDHFQQIQVIDTLPIGENLFRSGAAIRISKDGKFLYVSNRGHDSLTVFKVQTDASLEMIQNIPTYGKHPRDFNLSPDDRFLVVANLMSDNLSLFERDQESGLLKLLQDNVFAPEVTCVVFSETS